MAIFANIQVTRVANSAAHKGAEKRRKMAKMAKLIKPLPKPGLARARKKPAQKQAGLEGRTNRGKGEQEVLAAWVCG